MPKPIIVIGLMLLTSGFVGAQERPWGSLKPRMDSAPQKETNTGYQGRYNPWAGFSTQDKPEAEMSDDFRDAPKRSTREPRKRETYESAPKGGGRAIRQPETGYYPGNAYGLDGWGMSSPYYDYTYPYGGYDATYPGSIRSFPFDAWRSPDRRD